MISWRSANGMQSNPFISYSFMDPSSFLQCSLHSYKRNTLLKDHNISMKRTAVALIVCLEMIHFLPTSVWKMCWFFGLFRSGLICWYLSLYYHLLKMQKFLLCKYSIRIFVKLFGINEYTSQRGVSVFVYAYSPCARLLWDEGCICFSVYSVSFSQRN